MEVTTKCSSCNKPYELRYVSSHLQTNNLPLFLPCGHTMCETCIKTLFDFEGSLECTICQNITKIDSKDLGSDQNLLYELFPINIYMLGEITLQHLKKKKPSANKEKEDYYIDLSNIIRNIEGLEGKCVECQCSTTKFCQQCDISVCHDCFIRTHKNFAIFQSHTHKTMALQVYPSICKKHTGKSLDYYCKDCSKSICIDCLMLGSDKSCKEHNVSSIEEVNGDFIQKLKDVYPKVDDMFKRLTKTAVDIGNLLHEMENETNSSEIDSFIHTVEQYYSKLFANIQQNKVNVTDKIAMRKCTQEYSLLNLKSDITKSIIELKTVMKKITIADNPQTSNTRLNLPTLYEQAQTALKVPWFLSKNDFKEDHLKVEVKEDLCSDISNYINLQVSEDCNYTLLTSDELKEDEIPPPPTELVFPPEKAVESQPLPPKDQNKEQTRAKFYKDVPQYYSRNTTRPINSSSTSNSSYMSINSSINTNKIYSEEQHNRQDTKTVYSAVKPLQEGDQDLVHITHIIDPFEFWIQRPYMKDQFIQLQRELVNISRISPRPNANRVTVGKIFIAYNNDTNAWYRSLVLEEKQESHGVKYLMLAFDYGVKFLVTISKMCLIPQLKMTVPPPLAIQCRLANCQPIHGVWQKADVNLFEKLVNRDKVVVYVRHVHNEFNTQTLECDVTAFSTGVSVAHALVFHGRAYMPDTSLLYPKIAGLRTKPKLCPVERTAMKTDMGTIYITHIDSTDKFYVRKCNAQRDYNRMCEDMNKKYNHCSATFNTVYMPELGMLVAVQMGITSATSMPNWLRGIVNDILGHGKVRVFLVDIGSEVDVNFDALQMLHDKFTRMSPFAIQCYLISVVPKDNNWMKEATNLFHKFQDRPLDIHVEDIHELHGLGVKLYDNADPDNPIYINRELMTRKPAPLISLLSPKTKVINCKNIIDKSVKDEPIVDTSVQASQDNTRKCRILRRGEKPAALPAFENRNIDETLTQEPVKGPVKGPFKVEVKVLSCESPSSIYISLLYQEEAYIELNEQIQMYYMENNDHESVDWKVSENCCVFHEPSNQWHRAVVEEIHDEEVKIFHVDFGIFSKVNKSQLRNIKPEFIKLVQASIQCHLSGIAPGSGDTWPFIAKEYLRDLINEHDRIFICRSGEIENNSMPILLWAFRMKQDDALQPKKPEWNCLNSRLIENGLAIPVNNEDLPLLGSSEPSPGLELLSKITAAADRISEYSPSECIVEHVTWLPPSYLGSSEFFAVPTYVGPDAGIYIHILDQEDILNTINEKLHSEYKRSERRSWAVGDTCIAKSPSDGKLYRGKVLDVQSKTCIIHFIDHGKEEKCKIDELGDAFLYEIPALAYKCMLNGLKPIEKDWNEEVLDYIRKTVIEKTCFVKVVDFLPENDLSIVLHHNHKCLNTYLVENQMAAWSDESINVQEICITERTEELSEGNCDSNLSLIKDNHELYNKEISQDLDVHNKSANNIFDIKEFENKNWMDLIEQEEKIEKKNKFITYPINHNKEFLCDVTLLKNCDVYELNIIRDEAVTQLYDQLYEDVQNEGNTMPPLEHAAENMACIAKYSEDGNWYRACVMEIKENDDRVKVKYIDFGNCETLSFANIRESRPEWTELPPDSVTAKLYHVYLNPEVDLKEVEKDFMDTFMNKGPFHAKVMATEDSILYVELKNEKGELIYDKLIQGGILLKDN